MADKIDPNSDASAIVRVRLLALAGPFRRSIEDDIIRVCDLADHCDLAERQARAAIAAMQQPVHANETQRDFAWTATSGYKFYPPFVNLSKRDESYRLSVRAEETIDEKGHPRTGPQLEINLPPEAIAELRAALRLTALQVTAQSKQEGEG